MGESRGMKYSLVSAMVSADVDRNRLQRPEHDGLLAIGGWRQKNMPGAMLAHGPPWSIPAILCYGGTIKPGKLAPCDLTVVQALLSSGPVPRWRID